MKPIKDYRIIGDLHTAALVGKGDIDWLCLPDFDSGSVFAGLVDEDGGSFSVKKEGYSIVSDYIKDTAVLETSFESPAHMFRITDFMVPRPIDECRIHFLVRKVRQIKGSLPIKLYFEPKPGYKQEMTNIQIREEKIRMDTKKGLLELECPGADISMDKNKARITIVKDTDVVMKFIDKPCEFEEDYETFTTKFWRGWVSQGEFIDFCRDSMVRSAITLKLMQYYPTGAIIAAPTTSLPECIGGARNWDYRYVWIRDATFTLYALYILGYKEEAMRFFRFIEDITKEKDIRLIYTIRGDAPPEETSLDMTGYKGSKPVRAGNDAAKQYQLDIYGALIDSYYFMSQRGYGLTAQDKKTIRTLVKKISERWKEKDNGIWEIRQQKEHYTYSKVMAWVGVDRALLLAQELGLDEPVRQEWEELRDDIRSWIWQNCFHEGSLIQHPGTGRQDATNYLFVLLKFLDKHEMVSKTIIDNTGELRENGYVYRYKGDDGLPGDEGAFLLCSYWLISALAVLEDVDSAKDLFSGINGATQGLLSEEIDPKSGQYLGNYPQAFSHMGQIMSAHYIDKYRRRK